MMTQTLFISSEKNLSIPYLEVKLQQQEDFFLFKNIYSKVYYGLRVLKSVTGILSHKTCVRLDLNLITEFLVTNYKLFSKPLM